MTFSTPLSICFAQTNAHVSDSHRWFVPPISTVCFIPFLFLYCLFGRPLGFALTLLPPTLSSSPLSVLGTRTGNSREVKKCIISTPLTRNTNEMKFESRTHLYIYTIERIFERPGSFHPLSNRDFETFSWTLLGLEETRIDRMDGCAVCFYR